MNGNKSLYGIFAPAERLVLMLEAMARGDHGEADRLREECPRKNYQSVDVQFWQRAIISFDTAAIACSDLMHLCGKLQMLRWVHEILDTSTSLASIAAEGAFMDGLSCCAAHQREREGPALDEVSRRCQEIGQHIADNGRKLREIVSSVELHWAGVLATAWEAFGRFCRTRPGVEPLTMLSAWKLPAATEVEPVLKAFPQAQSQPEEVEEYCRLLCVLWDSRFEDSQWGNSHGH